MAHATSSPLLKLIERRCLEDSTRSQQRLLPSLVCGPWTLRNTERYAY